MPAKDEKAQSHTIEEAHAFRARRVADKTLLWAAESAQSGRQIAHRIDGPAIRTSLRTNQHQATD